MYNPGYQEGQFDLGMVDRVGNFQAGAFSSFKYVNFGQFQQGSWLGQASFLGDYLFNGGRIGFYGTEGFKNFAVLNSMELEPGLYEQTFARQMNQVGFERPSAPGARLISRATSACSSAHYQVQQAGLQHQTGAAHRLITWPSRSSYGYDESYVVIDPGCNRMSASASSSAASMDPEEFRQEQTSRPRWMSRASITRWARAAWA